MTLISQMYSKYEKEHIISSCATPIYFRDVKNAGETDKHQNNDESPVAAVEINDIGMCVYLVQWTKWWMEARQCYNGYNPVTNWLSR